MAVLSLAAGAPSARAATALVEEQVYETGKNPDYVSTLRFVAAPGERNDVVLASDGTTATITDRGAPVQPGPGCEAVDLHTVRCSAGRTLNATVSLGDGDDLARTDSALPIPHLQGGPGNDVLRLLDGVRSGELDGGDGDDQLLTDTADAHLAGGPGTDDLRGGPGSDVLIGGEGADRLDGGAGTDTASWVFEDRPVVADLRTGSGGVVGEPDTLLNIENLTGGSAADTLTGDDGPNVLEADGSTGGTARAAGDRLSGLGGDDALDGGAHDDVLDAGAGNDRLEGGGGTDRLRGGDGDDSLRLTGATGRADGGRGDDAIEIFAPLPARRGTQVAVCGAGQDRLRTATFTEVAFGCETVTIGDYPIVPPRRTPSGRVVVTALRAPPEHSSTCAELRLTSGGRTLGSRVVTRYPATVATRGRAGVGRWVTVRVRLADCRRRTLGAPIIAVRFRVAPATGSA